MKNDIVYYFVGSVLIGSCVYLANIVGIILPRIVRFYVNDFLIIPMVLTSVLFIVRKVQCQPKKTISLLNILYLCLMYSFLFEFWLPKFQERYTYDIVDVFLYFLSGFVFYRLQKEPKNEL